MNRKSTPLAGRESGLARVLTSGQSANPFEDWNSLLHGQVLAERELAQVGVEAPRNSLESSPGTRTPRATGAGHDDIPYGFEISKTATPSGYSSSRSPGGMNINSGPGSRNRSPAAVEVLPIKTLIAQDSSDAENDKKRRSAPSVVARLMGLDTLPDKLSKSSSPTARPPKPSRSSSAAHTAWRDAKPQSTKLESNSRPASPFHYVDTIKDFPLPTTRVQTDLDDYEDQSKFDVLPFRAHPQERQLQEFKKEFLEKLAKQRLGEPPFGKGGPDVNAKRRQLREQTSSGGGEPKRLSSAQKKLMESKEFQDAIELLQTNKEFFNKFFPATRKNSFSLSNRESPERENYNRRSFFHDDSSKDPTRYDDPSRRSFHLCDLSRDSREASSFDDPARESSRRSFHLKDLLKESRNLLLNSQGTSKGSSGRSFFVEDPCIDYKSSPRHGNVFSKEIRALEDYPDARRGGDVEFSGDPVLGTSDRREWRDLKYKVSGARSPAEELLVASKSSSVASMDKEVSSWTPDYDNGRHKSPQNLDSRKRSCSPSCIVVLKPGSGDTALLSPAMAPSRSPKSCGTLSGSQGVSQVCEGQLRVPQERYSPPRMEETKYPKEGLEESRVDPRAIARDIVREARINSTREVSRARDIGTMDFRPKDVRNSGSTGRNVSQQRHGNGMAEPATGVEVLLDSSDLSRGHHHKEEKSSSYSLPNPGPRVGSRGTVSNYKRFSHKEGKVQQQSSLEKPRSFHEVEQIDNEEHDIPICNVAHPPGCKKYDQPSISRPRSYLPFVKASVRKGHADVFPGSQLRSNDSEGAEMPNQTGNSSKEIEVLNRLESLDHFSLKGKRAEARQAFLLSKKNSASGGRRSIDYAASNQAFRAEEQIVVQDVYIDMNVGSATMQQPHNISVMERTNADNSLPIGDDERYGLRFCDDNDNLLEAGSQIKPEMQSQPRHDSEMHRLRKSLDQNELEGSKGLRAWSIDTQMILANRDGDGASETSVDTYGQPSPVSVLESPFEAEIPSPVKYKEFTSDLKDLQLKLRSLQLDGSERLRELSPDNLVAEHTYSSCEARELISTSLSTRKECSSQALWIKSGSLDIEGLPVPDGRQEDLVYVVNLLVASGFTKSNSLLTARWYSPSCPLDPALYKSLELYYDTRSEFTSEKGTIKSKLCTQGSHDSYYRRLLFDVLNEVLLCQLSPYLSYGPWARLHSLPTNQQFIQSILLEICSCFSVEGLEFDVVDSIMAKDIAQRGGWWDSQEFRKQVGLELEATILESLVEETVQAAFPSRRNIF